MKKICIFLLIITLIFVSANIAFNCKSAVSDDNLWKVICVKYPLLDEWEGFLFYRGNLSGNTGKIEVCTAEFNDLSSEEYVKCEAEKYYGRQFRDPLSISPVLAMGIKRPNTYSVFVCWDEPNHVILDIIWSEGGGRKNSKVVLTDK